MFPQFIHSASIPGGILTLVSIANGVATYACPDPTAPPAPHAPKAPQAPAGAH